MQNLDRFKFKVAITNNMARCNDLPCGIYEVQELKENMYFGTTVIIFYNNKRYELDSGNFEFQILQSTGLKDKNGGLIYEGDILRLNEYYVGNVIFQNGSFKIANSYISSLSCEYDFKNAKIIGSIYENTDLAKEHNLIN